METLNWENRIREWSVKCINSLTEQKKSQLPSDIIQSMWLGYPGTTEEQILSAEARLSVKFPPSYREFLKVTNGLNFVSIYGFKFYSTDEIYSYTEGVPDSAEAWIEAYEVDPLTDEEYFVYGKEQDPNYFRPKYMQTALEISDCDCDYNNDNGVCLLIPQVITSDGEWEAWIFDASMGGGAWRYRSFDEMMNAIFN
ncbi:MAG: SMI1/KNR4 family protein [Nostoc sp. NMS4]|nr:SMI1/KNR4 family protein [Nostoc sp. NMS4]